MRRIKPWVLSLTVHLIFFSIVIIVTTSNNIAVINPPLLYPARVDNQSAFEKQLETKPFSPALFRNEKIIPEKELIIEEVPEMELSNPPEFIVSQLSPERIPDTISIEVPSSGSYREAKRWRKMKQTPVAGSSQTVLNPAKPSAENIQNKLPDYPFESRRLGQEGLVVISVEVLKDGATGRIEIITSSGYSVLDESAIKAVRTWKFTPATINGQPANSTIKVPIRFKLN